MSRSTGRLPLRQSCHIPRSYGLVLSLALGLLLPSGTHAATDGDAQTYLRSAKQLLESLDYEEALEQLRLARQVFRTREQEVTLLLYEGILLAELTRWAESTAAFRNALALNSEVQFPVQVSPKVKERFESLREQAKREQAAILPPASEHDAPLKKPEPPIASAIETSSLPPQSPLSVAAASSSPRERSQSYSLVPAIAGGGLVVAGGVSWALSRGELNRLRTASPSLMREKDVRRSVSRGRTLQTLGITLLGAGAAGLLTAAGFYVLGGPAEPMTLGVGTTGSAAIIHWRWP
ncbi:hypothetical protein [Hyalangium sp.]|uniref:hypothetical protein n=1 Tax=Hyalangium sp. TaxID=2028555 RepID=UPI002D38FEA4|nr:hypothetical protein [Hyalangium sp.]HYI00495.1 hypothetical protein [Hyalangium sp.]